MKKTKEKEKKYLHRFKQICLTMLSMKLLIYVLDKVEYMKK